MRLERLILVTLGLGLLVACTDGLTGPEAAPAVDASHSAGERALGGRSPGETEYGCTFEIRNPAGGYRTRRAHIHLPAPELHPLGMLREYRYRAFAGEELVISARCMIPATERAGKRVDRLFNVFREHQQKPDDAIRSMSNECCPTVEVTTCQYGGSYYDGDCEGATTPEEDYSACYYFGECGGSGGWHWQPGNPANPTCDPATGCDPMADCIAKGHPECLQPLTGADSAALVSALGMVRTQFSDSTAARACAEMTASFRSAMSAGAVFRGRFDSGSTSDGEPPHYGSYYNRKLHFDPSALDAAAMGDITALRELVNTALHEGSHYTGAEHPAGYTLDAQLYSDPPFNQLNPGPNSCVPR
ncbi:hypothetical protein FHS01_001567 [Longimicrobium terrae]|uniref:Uncharacterized protein n=1 Tax=Longimicrobium terrae TaxID=1639882 RepID=A0A841GTL9_9BACT|nr:hypothetical protein [Longimicrobium terrae]MBB6069949.1 hypothetical protein [Longimicrobium terrae]